ncbi:response regulator [Derxia gummosa]|uniref:Virulence sensor protein BvgS n=1 Tax=Derxia gummosa DSM 723 TaxID=1121388 RepID=A0A9U5C4H9_9BURK|nr:response regulator [Derxia gummosa]
MTSNTSSLPALHEAAFARVLARNVGLPLLVSLLMSAAYIAIVFYMVSMARWVENADRTVARANAAQKLLIDAETGMRGFLLTGSNAFLEPYAMSLRDFDAQLTAMREFSLGEPEQIARIDRIAAQHARWISYADEAIGRRREGRSFDSISGFVASERGKSMMDGMRTEFTGFIGAEEAMRDRRSAQSSDTVSYAVAATLLIGLLAGGGMAVNGRRQVRALADAYGDSLDAAASHAKALERDAWMSSGETELSAAKSGERTPEAIAEGVLGFFVRRFEATVGVAYLSRDHAQFERAAVHAFTPDASHPPRLLLREGLLGQTAADGLARFIDVPPEGYLRVGSALGTGEVRHLVLFAAHGDRGANLVVELGFLAPPHEALAEFIATVEQRIGRTIDTAVYRERLHDVLTETQQLNEELQAQQEELKVANEELEEQSRVLRESQARLENQQAELEQTNEQLDQRNRLLNAQKDQLDQRNADLREAQSQLLARAEELQRASQYKSEFLANMSHELRTPLNSTLILARLLADNPKGNLDEEQVRFAESIASAGDDLMRLISDILDLSKVEAGKLDIQPETVVLDALLADLERQFRPVARDKQLGFELTLAEGLPETIVTDPLRLQQILKNLLSNAFKFTDAGTVRLDAAPAADGHVAISVSDTGIGIAPEQQKQVFEAFRQADGTVNRRFGGTGLGLSISRELAMLLGARIELRSAPGQGSRFTVTLPRDLAEAPPADPMLRTAQMDALREMLDDDVQPGSEAGAIAADGEAGTRDRLAAVGIGVGIGIGPDSAEVPDRPGAAPQAPNGAVRPARRHHPGDDRARLVHGKRTVLIVEDDHDFAVELCRVAHELGFNCLMADDADDAIADALRYLPDAVLLDMKLPDHAALTVLERLKRDSGTRHIPVHMVSATDGGQPGLPIDAIGPVLGPGDLDALKAVFARVEGRFAQKVRRVLVVEDDANQRDAMARLIADAEVEVTAVGLAEDALGALRDTVFDCMIVDLTLPDMAGRELLARMAEGDICSFPPVIVYTGRVLSREEEAELRRYSRSIIIKGARSPERLLDEVTLFLHRVERTPAPARQQMLRAVRNREHVFEGRRVLLVDDDVRNIFALTSALEHKGAGVVIARNGREALAKLDEQPEFDLVLMDIMMPEMDGYEAMRQIRKQPRFARLPIIGVTAKAMRDDQEKCIEAGANDYLSKPVDLDKLLSLMRVWMPKADRP